MRIAYISLHWPRTFLIGVGRKINEQLLAWKQAGHDVRLFMHTSKYQPENELIPGETYFYNERKGFLGSSRREYERYTAAVGLIAAVQDFKPHVIYLRYGIYVFPIHNLAMIAPAIEEINTNDVVQHKDLGRIYDFYNRITRGILLKKMKGLVCVSDELAASPEFSKYKKPTEVISNGLNLDAIQPLPAPKNKFPRLVFIATPGYNWHGVDKLVTLAKRYPDIEIDLVGYDRLETTTDKPNNLNLLGYLSPSNSQTVLAHADLALGTLALHRKNMDEASPLKTRECLAFGLPMVLPYKDTDLDNLECDFLLRIPNRADNIDTYAEAIHAFSYQMIGKRADRSLLIPRIDSKAKERKRLAFFMKISGSGIEMNLPSGVS